MSAEGTEIGEVAVGAAVSSNGGQDVIPHSPDPPRSTCRNCGAVITGKFCGECAQPAHIHRSLRALGHDIVHSVFHFEGKFGQTLPLLVLHPGELTRRYIDGERAKFVSPMALFLLTVLVMFAAFSLFAGNGVVDGADIETGHRNALATTDRTLAELRGRLADPELEAVQRAAIEKEIAELEILRSLTQAFSPRGENSIDDAQLQSGASEQPEKAIRSGWLSGALEKLNANRDLLLFKLKTNGYKFSWLLIPMSIPFMWLIFLGRRDVQLYDHAIFVTYSISFMMLFAVAMSLLGILGATSDFVELLLIIVPPLHMYRQLRGTYGLSRAGAFARLVFVLVAAISVLLIFVMLLFVAGTAS